MVPIELGAAAPGWARDDGAAWPRRAAAADGGADGTRFAATLRAIHDDIARVVRDGFDDAGGMAVPVEAAGTPPAWRSTPAGAANALAAAGLSGVGSGLALAPGSDEADKTAFVGRLAPLASDAARRLGVGSDLLLAQAALESDWGRRPLRDTAGRDTHNLFGVKAGTDWHGGTADAVTTEYRNGNGVKTVQRFRAYPDDRSAMADYVSLLQTNPRFADARRTGADAGRFARALARGGYATDPDYAGKLDRVAHDVAAREAAQPAGAGAGRPATDHD